MTDRYFKATDGVRTYFRASPTRVYRSMSTGQGYNRRDTVLHMHDRGMFPAVEITRAEYNALMALKRIRTAGRTYHSSAPSDSWVENSEIAAAAPATHADVVAAVAELAPVPTKNAGTTSNPTRSTYNGLTQAYDFFNAKLFAGKLPRCLITMQRHKGAYGYFAGERFGTRDDAEIIDEIALNPQHFRDRDVTQTLSTLVHEMCHLRQHHFGKPSRGGYHNAEWAAMMRDVGLVPSSTGEIGGKETGQRVSHYIEKHGRFDQAVTELVGRGIDIRYVDRWDTPEARKVRRTKAASKTKYTCPECDLNAWAKPDAQLVCGECGEAMIADA